MMVPSANGSMTSGPILQVRNLSVGYVSGEGVSTEVVRDVELTLNRGQIVGLVGESGCGKSTTALAAIGYRGPGVRILGGESRLGDVDLVTLPTESLRAVWGRRIAFVAQHAGVSLNPALRIGDQLRDPIAAHLGLRGDALRHRQIELLEQMEIPDPDRALSRYPFQFSGGQQQRIAIAIALSCRPDLLVLDEPTTGLDATTQSHISALLKSLVKDTGVAVLYVSHDLALLNALADEIAVMYAGQVVERGPTGIIVAEAQHPYTRALMQAAPSLRRPGVIRGIPGRPPSSVVTAACAFAPRCPHVADACRAAGVEMAGSEDHVVRCIRAREIGHMQTVPGILPRSPAGAVVLEARDLVCTHPSAEAPVVRAVSLRLHAGETLGIVGESGSGKSTLLRALIGLHPPRSGAIAYKGVPLAPHIAQRPMDTRRALQLIFQDPHSSLNPRQTVRSLVARPIQLFRDDVPRSRVASEVAELLDAVRLPRLVLDRYPAELSGGQKQRVAIARAFAAKPAVLLCDEVTSALDVSVQAAIIELLAELSAERGVATIFVSHDLAVIRALASRTMVMRNGEICEQGQSDELFRAPQHPYTRALLAAMPEMFVAA